MSDEQLELTLKEPTESLFRLRLQVADRAAGRPQRAAQAPPTDRPDQDDPDASGSWQAAASRPPATITRRQRRSRDVSTQAQVGNRAHAQAS